MVYFEKGLLGFQFNAGMDWVEGEGTRDDCELNFSIIFDFCWVSNDPAVKMPNEPFSIAIKVSNGFEKDEMEIVILDFRYRN